MTVTRRTFLKIAASMAGLAASGGFAAANYVRKHRNALRGTVSKKGVCPLCPAHCIMKSYYKNGELVYTGSLRNDPSSAGKLCTKGILLPFRKRNQDQLEDIVYAKSGTISRIPYAAAVEMSVDALRRLRDDTFVVKNEEGQINASDAIAFVGGATLTNEEAYLGAKFARIAGIRNVCADSSVCEQSDRAEIATYGVPAQQNPIFDLEHSDAVLLIAANPVRSCTAISGHVMRAKARGAALIVIDPMKSETASVADIHLTIRPGTDEIVLAGMINHFLRNGKIDTAYLARNTDAGFIVNDGFSFDETGRFSGYDAKLGLYTDTASWSYVIDERGNPRIDARLARSNCVFAYLKNYYSKYTPDFVVRQSGVNGSDFLKACELYNSTSKNDMSGGIVYGSPLSSSFAALRLMNILQLLLGNVGIRGGGVYCASSVFNHQGVRDQLSEGYLPGYIPLPKSTDSYESWLRDNAPQVNMQESPNLKKDQALHFVAIAQSWYAKSDPAEAFRLLPRRNRIEAAKIAEAIEKGELRALILFESSFFDSVSEERRKELLGKLDLVIICTADEKSRRAVKYMDAAKECFVFPVVSIDEKTGTITAPDRRISAINGRRKTAVRRTTFTVTADLMRSLKKIYKIDGGAFPEPLLCETGETYSLRKTACELYGTESLAGANWLYSSVLSKNYRPDASSAKMRVWGDPWLYERCAITEERTLSTAKSSPFAKEIIKQPYTLAFPFLPWGRAQLFSSDITPFPEIAEVSDVQLSAAAGGQRGAAVQGIERDLLFARHSEMRYLALNDAYTAFFPGEELLISGDTARQLGVLRGDKVRVSFPGQKQTKVFSIRVSGQVDDSCATLITLMKNACLDSRIAQKVTLEKVI